jgi:hypothetical protein
MCIYIYIYMICIYMYVYIYIHKMEYYSAIRKNEIVLFEGKMDGTRD